ncbi:hypothetical protein ACE41H_18430 [Paenibacillus enshidis]|uniref:DUF600 family protein n=1 Tax=Paenibacillus enshidis TaxID=1458439 RepID=A0ABV5AX08_9BACL
MAILRDCLENGTWIEISFIACIPGEDEGCRLNVKYFKTNNKIYDLDFGWTNITIKNYIEATAEFPVERLDGLYSSFEKHLFQLDWKQIDSNGVYRLGFFGSDQDFKIHADQESVRRFGSEFRLEWGQAPLRT